MSQGLQLRPKDVLELGQLERSLSRSAECGRARVHPEAGANSQHCEVITMEQMAAALR